MPSKADALRVRRWADKAGNQWSLYKISEPIQFSEDEEVYGYLLISRQLATFYLSIRTAWYEYDQRFETQAFPADNEGKPLEFLDLFLEKKVYDHDQMMTDHGYEVQVIG